MGSSKEGAALSTESPVATVSIATPECCTLRPLFHCACSELERSHTFLSAADQQGHTEKRAPESLTGRRRR